MTNNSSLRDSSILLQLIQYIIRRIKENNQNRESINHETLFPLISREHLPFCCNFALVLLDLALLPISSSSPEKQSQSCSLLLTCLDGFTAFSSQSNNLLHILLYFPSSIISACLSTHLKARELSVLIADWFLDISLIQHDISRSSAGSILPGLSQERVQRLLQKKESLTLADIRPIKLHIILQTSYDSLFSSSYFAACFTLLCDSDTEVSKQAGFKRHNFISQFNEKLSEEERTSFIQTILTFFGSSASKESHRTRFSDDISCVMLDFIHKNFHVNLLSIGHSLLPLVSEVFSVGSTTPIRGDRFQASLLTFIEGLLGLKALNASSASPFVIPLLSIVTRLVSSFSVSSGQSQDNTARRTVRRTCYRLLSTLHQFRQEDDGIEASDGMRVLLTLFRLLDVEESESLVDLYSLLETLRAIFERPRSSQGLSSGNDSHMELLLSALRKCFLSENPKRKQVSLLWSRSLFGFNEFTLESCLQLADDVDEDVAKTAADLMTAYQVLIKEDASLVVRTSRCSSFFRLACRTLSPSPSSSCRSAAVLGRSKAILALLSCISAHLRVHLSPLDPDADLSSSSIFLDLLGSGSIQKSLMDTSLASSVLSSIQESNLLAIADKDHQMALAEALFLLLLVSKTSQRSSLSSAFLSQCLTLLGSIRITDKQTLRHLSLVIGLQGLEGSSLLLQDFLSLLCIQLLGTLDIRRLFCSSAVVECLLFRLFNFEDNDVKREILRFCKAYVELVVVPQFQLLGNNSVIVSSEGNDHMALFVSSLHALAPLFACLGSPDSRQVYHQNARKLPNSIYLNVLPPLEGHENFLDFIIDSAVRFLSTGCNRCSAELVMFLSYLSCAGISIPLFQRVWDALMNPSVLFGSLSVFRFKVSEALGQMSSIGQQQPQIANGLATLHSPLSKLEGLDVDNPLLTHLLSLISKHAADVDMTRRSTVNVLLLVLLNHTERQNSTFLLQCVRWFLKSLRENHLFLQDISCLGLCRIFSLVNCSKDETMKTLIVNEVVAALTKERRLAVPVGYDQAGNTTLVPEARSNATTAAPTVPDNTAGNNSPFAAAEGTLAAELGLFLETTAPRVGGFTDESDSTSYGVYSTVCRIVKKTGYPSLLFTVLGLIQRDPDLSSGEEKVLYDKYCSQMPILTDMELRQLLPVLFVYQYEPVLLVREIMVKLWKRIVPKDSSKVLVDSLQNEILEALITHLGNRSWRNREAACLALESFLFSRSWEVIWRHLNSLWSAGVKVLDDVRDTTRKAALGFMKTLSGVIVKSCDPSESSGSTIDTSIDFIVPWLLDKGLLQPSQEALGFAFGLLLQIIKTTGLHLRLYVARIVGVLVEAMSALEPKALAYIEFHTQTLNVAHEDYENNRLRIAQASPMQESLDWCLRSLDPVAIPRVLAVLREAMNHGVGLATKVQSLVELFFFSLILQFRFLLPCLFLSS